MPVETRELRYFIAVAEELHFGRAAQRLAMTQPPLSRAIQQLERRLGVMLFRRDARSISLTPSGEALLREGKVALNALDTARRRAQEAASRQPRPIVLATKAGVSRELLSRLLESYASAPRTMAVEVVLCGPGQHERLLREERADVALLQLPYDNVAGFHSEVLQTEPQILVLPSKHPVANRPGISIAEVEALSDLPLPRWPRSDGSYGEGAGPKVSDQTQLLQLIALGRACAFAPESVRSALSIEHAAVPVTDAPPVTTVIAWPTHRTSQGVADLVRTAIELRPAPFESGRV